MAIDNQWFENRIRDAGLSQRQLSKMFSNSYGTVGMVLTGKRRLSAEELPPVASALGVTVDELLRRLGIAPPSTAIDRDTTVPVIGVVSETATVEEARTAMRSPNPAGDGKHTAAILMQSATGDGPYQGWTYYIENPPGKDRPVDASSLNALCVVQIGDHAGRYLGIVKRGAEAGRYNLVNPFNGAAIVSGVLVRNAQPVTWIKTPA